MDRALGVAGVAAALPGLLQVCRNATLLIDYESTSLLLAGVPAGNIQKLIPCAMSVGSGSIDVLLATS